tara:strand:+ start:1320 stop:1469 length:150 start_codon:yes stop_codon:yes gene_type:complete
LSEEEMSLSSLLEKVKQRIHYIKNHGNAFVIDWTLVELIESIVEKLEKR